MSCPASIHSGPVTVYCNRVDGHTDSLHVASVGPDYLALGIALEIWDDTGRRYLPHEPEHRTAITAAREERPGLEVIR
jgi:hypothetical protein